MARLGINTGAIGNDGTGDSLRAAGGKINSNFLELYTYLGAGSTDTLSAPIWDKTISGINTLSNVGIGTIDPRFSLEVGAVGASGTSLWVNGDARITGILTVGTSSITLDGTNNKINVGLGVTIDGNSGIINASSINLGGTTLTGAAVTYITAGSGISVDQSTGNVTITATGGGGGGSQTLNDTLGLGNTSSVGMSVGVVTASSFVKTGGTSSQFLKADGSVDTSTYATETYVGLATTGLLSSTGNGSSLTGIVTYIEAGSGISIDQSTGKVIISNTGGGGGGESYWASTTAGIHTLSNVGIGTTNPTSELTVSGNISVSGVVTATSFNGTASYSTIAGIATYATTAGVSTSVIGGIASITQLNVSGISTLLSNVSVGGTISVNGGVTLATNNATIVGTSATAGEIKRIGGAPFFYDGSAWREFVLSSGTPVSVPADTEWDNVVFRATFDTDFTDSKFGVSPVYVGAGASIVGAAVTIGTGAYRNIGGNAVGVGVSYAYRSDYDFTGSWTIEFWIYHDSIPTAYESLVSQFRSDDADSEWTFGVYNNGFNIYWIWANENATVNRTLYSINNTDFGNKFVDKWNHIALVREGSNGSLHFYINGIESSTTADSTIIDNDILHVNGAGLYIGAPSLNSYPYINSIYWNNGYNIDAIFDDMRISAGVGTAGQRYNSIGISTYATFTPPTTALPTTGTLSSYVQPPGDKYGEITLGGSPTWRGTSGVTVSQQSSGNYRVSFASSYTNSNDYYVLSQGMDQGFASYVGIARSITHVDLSINRQSNDAAVDTGSLAVQIKNHI